jgi:hypothetical protein
VSATFSEDESSYLDQIIYQKAGQDQPSSGSSPVTSSRTLLNKEGVGPIATSLDHEKLVSWDKSLETAAQSEGHPYSSLCYLTSYERNALLYRAVDTSGRNSSFAHVLIGSRDVLTPERALGSWLWTWPGAMKPGDRIESDMLRRVKADDFTEAASEGWDALRNEDKEIPGFTALMDDLFGPREVADLGGKKFVIIIDGSDSYFPVRVLSRIILSLDPSVIDSGFSIHQPQYDDSIPELPRFVFATKPQVQPLSKVSRTQIKLDAAAAQRDDKVKERVWSKIKEYRNSLIDPGTTEQSDGTPKSPAPTDGKAVDSGPADGGGPEDVAAGGTGLPNGRSEEQSISSAAKVNTPTGLLGGGEEHAKPSEGSDEDGALPLDQGSDPIRQGLGTRQPGPSQQPPWGPVSPPGLPGADAFGNDVELIIQASALPVPSIIEMFRRRIMEMGVRRLDHAVVCRALANQSFYGDKMNDLGNDDRDDFFQVLTDFALPADGTEIPDQEVIIALVYDQKIPLPLTTKILVRLYPDKRVPQWLKEGVGTRRLDKLGFAVQPPPESSPEPVPYHGSLLSSAVWLFVALAAVFLLIMALLILGGMT